MEAHDITPQMIRQYRDNGFVRVPGVISGKQAAYYFDAAMRLIEKMRSDQIAHKDGFIEFEIFSQLVNAWRRDDEMRSLTFHPNVGEAAQVLSGGPLRLWHDHILCKMPQNDASTEFHQDQPYWPHDNCPNPISAWIALCDVPVERGCMTFIPKSHLKTDLQVQHLNDPRSLFTICPELEYYPRVTMPLKAGDCTFHHGRCAHMATPNLTDLSRMAHVVIYMAHDTRYREITHILTDPLELTGGAPLDGPLFPTVANMQEC